MPDHITSSPAVASDEVPGWAMGPVRPDAVGVDARGSWLLEPDTGTGMLLYPRNWLFAERRDVCGYLRGEGWSVVPASRFLHVTTDGGTVIRLLARSAEPATAGGLGEVLELRCPTPDTDQIEASV